MKKFIVGLLIVFLGIFVVFIISELQYKYFPASLIGMKNYQALFEYCKPQISVDNIPRTTLELSKKPKQGYERIMLYQNIANNPDVDINRLKLFELLGDKVSNENKKSFSQYCTINNKTYEFYYDYNGKLMLIEFGKQLSEETSLEKIKWYSCSYNNVGKLVNATYSTNDDEAYYFNNRQELIYDLTVTHFGVIYSAIYNDYLLP